MQVGQRPEFIEAADEIDQAHSGLVLLGPATVDMSQERDGALLAVANPLDANRVAGLQPRGSSRRCREIDVHDRPIAAVVHALQAGGARIRLRRQTAGEVQHVRSDRAVLHLVDGGSAHRACNRNRGTHRRNEDDIAGLQPLVRAGITVQQQVVQVDATDDLAGPLELDIAQ